MGMCPNITLKEDAMAKPDYLDTLIDKASKSCGSSYKLAQRIGVSPQTVSDWKHERKPCPVADQVLMAHVAGLESEIWAVRAIVAQYEGTPKGAMLSRALGKALAATGAALVSSGVNALPILSMADQGVTYFIRRILRTQIFADRRQQARL